MNRYTKVIGIMGSYYTKEHVKIKHHKNKVREINESTVIKNFKAGNTEVLVYFMETGEEKFIDEFTDEETIRKYLGKKFV